MTTTYVMTAEHPRWPEFLRRMADEFCECNSDHALTERILQEMGADVPASVVYLEDRGGYCDCEVILNVAAAA